MRQHRAKNNHRQASQKELPFPANLVFSVFLAIGSATDVALPYCGTQTAYSRPRQTVFASFSPACHRALGEVAGDFFFS
jgi:hypothetical protein